MSAQLRISNSLLQRFAHAPRGPFEGRTFRAGVLTQTVGPFVDSYSDAHKKLMLVCNAGQHVVCLFYGGKTVGDEWVEYFSNFTLKTGCIPVRIGSEDVEFRCSEEMFKFACMLLHQNNGKVTEDQVGSI